MNIASSLLVLLFLTAPAFAQLPRDSLQHRVLLKSGDSFRGRLVAHTDSTVTIVTEFDRVTILKVDIERFIPLDGPYLRKPHHYLMPTGSPSGPGGFLGNYELGFLYGGFGLGYGATITAGATLVPTVPLEDQLFHLGAKVTVERGRDFDLAVGAAYTWITLDQPYGHIYAVATFPTGTARYSAMLLYRATGDEIGRGTIVALDNDTTDFTIYYTGSVGAAFGFDAPAFGRDDMMWVAEIWNNDVSNPRNTVSMVGMRVMNEKLAADIGIAIFTSPMVVPVVGFVWTF
jgi:hypothetical protein